MTDWADLEDGTTGTSVAFLAGLEYCSTYCLLFLDLVGELRQISCHGWS